MHIDLGGGLLGLPETLGDDRDPGADLKDIGHAGHTARVRRVKSERLRAGHRRAHHDCVMHALYVHINAELRGTGGLGNRINPAGFLTNIFELGGGLECSVGINVE